LSITFSGGIILQKVDNPAFKCFEIFQIFLDKLIGQLSIASWRKRSVLP
jgi:hypothetical protein